MSNYPDNFKGMPYDSEKDADREQIERLQQCHKDILTGVIGACVKNRVCPSKDDLHALVQNIREFIGETAFDMIDNEIEVLATSETQDIERTYEVILDSFRVKPIDWNAATRGLFRALAPQNPGTLISSGKESA